MINVGLHILAEMITLNTIGTAEVEEVYWDLGAGIKHHTVVVTYSSELMGESSYQALNCDEAKRAYLYIMPIEEAIKITENTKNFLIKLTS